MQFADESCWNQDQQRRVWWGQSGACRECGFSGLLREYVINLFLERTAARAGVRFKVMWSQSNPFFYKQIGHSPRLWVRVCGNPVYSNSCRLLPTLSPGLSPASGREEALRVRSACCSNTFPHQFESRPTRCAESLFALARLVVVKR